MSKANKKMKINNFKDLEKFLNKHKVDYPKEWNSKFNKIKRKDRNASTWKDCRTCLYALDRIYYCLIAVTNEMRIISEKLVKRSEKIGTKKLAKLMIKHSLTVDIIKNKIWPEFLALEDKKFHLNIIKKGGKSYYKFKFTPELLKFEKMIGLKIPRFIKLPKKKDTIIKTMMEEDAYWNFRHDIMGKPIEDKNKKNIVRKEAQEYFKSVCTYIKQPKYNKNFFISHQKPFEKQWNNYWNFYLKVR